MIALNLLSPEQKNTLLARVIYAMIERLMIFFVALTLSLAIVLLLVKISLTQVLTVAISRQVLSSQYVGVNNETKRLNNIAIQVAKLQSAIVPIDSLIEDVASRTPPGITLDSLNYDVKSNAMGLSGRADTRGHLLDYEEALRGSPFVKSLDSPISNLFQKTDISFTLQAITDTDAVRKRLEP